MSSTKRDTDIADETIDVPNTDEDSCLSSEDSTSSTHYQSLDAKTSKSNTGAFVMSESIKENPSPQSNMTDETKYIKTSEVQSEAKDDPEEIEEIFSSSNEPSIQCPAASDDSRIRIIENNGKVICTEIDVVSAHQQNDSLASSLSVSEEKNCGVEDGSRLHLQIDPMDEVCRQLANQSVEPQTEDLHTSLQNNAEKSHDNKGLFMTKGKHDSFSCQRGENHIFDKSDLIECSGNTYPESVCELEKNSCYEEAMFNSKPKEETQESESKKGKINESIESVENGLLSQKEIVENNSDVLLPSIEDKLSEKEILNNSSQEISESEYDKDQLDLRNSEDIDQPVQQLPPNNANDDNPIQSHILKAYTDTESFPDENNKPAPSLSESPASNSSWFHVPTPSPASNAPASSTSWASVSDNSLSANEANSCGAFANNFMLTLKAAESNTMSLDDSLKTSEHNQETSRKFQPLRRASARICKQIQSLQEQLRVASSSTNTSHKTIEKLKQQLSEAQEMSASFENIKRQRSASRPSQCKTHRSSTPGKVVRPYRQWQTMSPCVAYDPRYIFSSKEDRKSKEAPFMRVKVKTSDNLYKKRFQTLTGMSISNNLQDLGNINEDVGENPHINEASDSQNIMDFPNTKQLVSEIEQREANIETFSTNDAAKCNAGILGNVTSKQNIPRHEHAQLSTETHSNQTSHERGHLVDKQSSEIVAVGRDAAFYHRRNTDLVPNLNRRHSMLLIGTPKPYTNLNKDENHLSFLDLYNKQPTMNERFERASQRINTPLQNQPKTHIDPELQSASLDGAITPVTSSHTLTEDKYSSEAVIAENKYRPVGKQKQQRELSPGKTLVSLASDLVLGPDDDADTPRLRPSVRASRAPPRETTVHHPRKKTATSSRLHRQKERSLHRMAFRARSRTPNLSSAAARPAGYGVYMKAATDYIERVELAAARRGGADEEGGAASGGEMTSCLRTDDDKAESLNATTVNGLPLRPGADTDDLTNSALREDTTAVTSKQTNDNFMQKIHREKKKTNGGKYVTVVAARDHAGTLPGLLTFRVGQVLQLRCPQFEPTDGLCYGHYRQGRFRKKKKGLFPLSHIRFPSEMQTSL